MEQFTPVSPAPAVRTYGGVPDALILAGAAVGLATSILMILMMALQGLVFGAVLPQLRDNGFGAFIWIPIAMGVLALVGILGAILAFLARGNLKRSDGQEGGGQGVAAGILMIVGMNMLGGVLVLVGAILAGQQRTPR